MFVIGLTGGMGTGKSEAAGMLEQMGARVIKADEVGHRVYDRGTEGWRAVVDAFGEGILAPSGEIDRQRLGRLAFSSPEQLRRLNETVHPLMRRLMEQRLGKLEGEGARAVVLEAAILLEAGWDELVDEVWVIVAPDTVATERIRARTGMPREEIGRRIGAQMPEAERTRRATVVIENAGDLDALRRQVQSWWSQRVTQGVAGRCQSNTSRAT